MKKTKECNWGWKILTAISSLVLVLTLGLCMESFSIVSYAQSQCKVIVRSANIRQDADAASQPLGSAEEGDSLTIKSQKTGTDGKTWYQVFVNAEVLGYIRSDLVEITDGTTPTTSTDASNNATTTTPQEPASNEAMADVTAVEPLSATVTGGRSVNVRSNASTGSQIVTKAQDGLALTVTGHANGTDGKIWYQVKFLSNNAEVTGFIRSDYVVLSGELVPVTTQPESSGEGENAETPAVTDEPEVVKDWDTQNDGGTWYLVDNVNVGRYNISEIFETVKKNQEAYTAEVEKVESQKVVIIILVIVALGLAGAVAFLIFKIKDMMDSAYFAEVERETVRRRTADRPTGADKKVMHTVGADKKPGTARPAGAPQAGATRQAGARPVGASGQGGQRPMPNGAKPGTSMQGAQKPVQSGAKPGAPRQDGQKPVQGSPKPQGGQRPVQNGEPQSVRPSAPAKPQQSSNPQNATWKSKNFMTDDDEFEFEFLNWDGEDE